ncbi:sporulation protein YpjB [Fictibacillus nanhaiensis]|uniref:sporulation protein YpjB n=1 Tax=Fictibacillus nanhaiensis TaxID=742169 RepID=UPI001C955C9D|nr:sporulation protein YpjB [Fictibacillus nanhaiensis]MBY6035710.1 sporulation protein YpjB [Fictibacillus nanhaiensis]
MRRLGWAIAVISFALGLVIPVHATNHTSDEVKEWSEINELTSEIWELGKLERYNEAADVLKFTSDNMTHIEEVLSLRPDQQRLVEYTFSEAVTSLQNPEWSKEKKLNKLTEVRLLVDALQTSYEPLWKKTGLMMLEPFISMKKGIGKNDSAMFHQAANLLLERYETLRPALTVDLKSDEIDMLDEHVSYVDRNRNEILSEVEHQKHLEVISADFEALFFAKKDNSEPSLFWLIFSIGGIISSTLFYVGWRKYKGDKEEEEALRVPQKR